MIIPMFQIPLVHLKVQNWVTKQKELLSLFDSVKPHIGFDNTLYTDFWNESRPDYSSKISSIFDDEIKEASKLLLYNIKIKSAWFQVTKKNNFHVPHNHGPKGFSSVCYIKYNKEAHSSITFISPYNDLVAGHELFYSPEISEGDILFFPSALIHFTEPNIDKGKRIVVSFNFDVIPLK